MLHGFFSADRDRAALWSGAHQLLCRVNDDRRFQPTPERTFVAWTAEHCARALTRARELKGLLARLAAGDFPSELPVGLIGARGYLGLPPKPGGEPKIDLGGYTAEMAFDLPAVAIMARPTRTRAKEERTESSPVNQLGLFDPAGPSVAMKAESPAQTGPKLRL